MATIRDVAELAHVSVATVSRVINEKGYVNESTKEKVKQAVDQLSYKPNEVARTLYKGRSQMIALFVPDIMNPFFPELARAVEDIANQNGYTFVLCNTDDDPDKINTYTAGMQQKSVDGMIIVSSVLTTDSFKNVNVPVIALDRIFTSDLSAVTADNYQAGIQAAQYLMELGCQCIAHISGQESASNTMDRQQGYLDMVQHKKWFLSDYVVSGKYNLQESKEVTCQLLTAHPEIDGIFAANDLMGLGAIKAAESLGIQVPDDLSIIGFDGIKMGEIATPSLTTIQQPIYKMGAAAAEMLIQEINDHTLPKKIKQLPVQLVERQSTKRKRDTIE